MTQPPTRGTRAPAPAATVAGGRAEISGPSIPTAPPRGGPFRVRTKDVDRHIAELDALVGRDLDDIIVTSRDAVATRLHLAKSEVELNVWMTTAR